MSLIERIRARDAKVAVIGLELCSALAAPCTCQPRATHWAAIAARTVALSSTTSTRCGARGGSVSSPASGHLLTPAQQR